MPTRTTLVISALAAGGLLAAALLRPDARAQPTDDTAAAAAAPIVVELDQARSREGGSIAWMPASVVSRNDARLAGEVTGRLIFVAEIGSELAAGDPVARIDDETLRLELREAEAGVGRQQAEREQAQRHHQRLAALRDSKLVSASQIDEAAAQWEIRERELAQAEVARDRARHRLGLAIIRAPHAGVVVERLVQVGEYLQAGGAVARLVQTADVELSARAPAHLASRLSPGQHVTVRQNDEERLARIRAVVPAADTQSRQIELRLALDDGRWLVGSAADVALPQGDIVATITVPRDALVLRPEGTFVFRIGDDGVARRIQVTAGAVQGDWVDVADGVAAGDRLVVRGAERLRDGDTVAVRGARTSMQEMQALAAINTSMKAG